MESTVERKDLEPLLAVAARLNLPVPEIYRRGVIKNLERLLEQARLVMEAPASPSLDPPGEFRP